MTRTEAAASTRRVAAPSLIGLTVVLVIASVGSVVVGAAGIGVGTVADLILAPDPGDVAQATILELRLPRALVGALVGAALAVSGAVMQGLTRNPLAGPSIMGVSAGSAFAIALVFAVVATPSYPLLIVLSFAGAALASALVYGVGSLTSSGLTPVRLALAGAAVSALLGALSTGIVIHLELAQDILFWYAGGVAGVTWSEVRLLAPLVVVGLILATALGRQVSVLNLGEEVAAGLGQRPGTVKAIGALLVVVLTGAAVSTAGVIGFVGLLVPHMVRAVVGVDYRIVIPASALAGAALTQVADIGARMINPPYETPLGVLTAVVGVPFFLYLARRRDMVV